MSIDSAEKSDSLPCSSRAYKVGDCVILNDVEQPCARMVCVVVGVYGDNGDRHYEVKYLNADRVFDSYNKPPMASYLKKATPLEDFGVVIRTDGDLYWCEKRGESSATYADGKPRKWQEWGEPIRWKHRKDVAALVWPF